MTRSQEIRRKVLEWLDAHALEIDQPDRRAEGWHIKIRRDGSVAVRYLLKDDYLPSSQQGG